MTATGIAASLATHLREPMRRSAYALIAGTGLTTLLGMVFWLLVARLLPTDAVGTGTALVSAMTFLATLSTLGLRNSLVRFLAPAGASARRLIITSYLLCTSAASVTAVVFIAGQPWWADNLGFLRENRFVAFAFVIATMVWVLFVLEDHVLIGLRRAGWVPVTNGIYSGVKIALLPALVSGGAYALLAATALPAVPIVVVVTSFVLWVTGRRIRVGESVGKLRIAQLVRFALADHSSTILWLATTELLTLVVLQEAGPQASAYYFMSFTIAYALYLVTSNIGSAFVAEAARYPSRAAALAGAALRQAAILVVPLALLAVVLARFGLGLLGDEYAANGTVVLRLLLLSAIPQVVIGIALNAARVRRDNRLILAVYGAQALGVFGGTVLTIERLGLTGVGLAWLATQTTVALVLVLTKRTGTEGGTMDLAGVVGLAGWFVSRLRRGRNRRLARKLVPSALSALGLPIQHTDYRLLISDSDSLVASIASETDQAVLKIATTAAASRGLNRHAEMVSTLRESLGQSRMLSLVPQVLQKTTVQGYRVLLENRLPGMVYRSRMAESSELGAAALAISDLHRMTRSNTVVDEALLRDWVGTPISQLRRVPTLNGQEFAFHRLMEELYGALMDQQVTTSYVHGDYWLGNVLLERTDGRVKGTGIVDWENARPVGIPDCDLIHLWLTSQPGELGMTVRRALLSPDDLHSAITGLGMSWANPQLPTSHLVLLAWLWHVTAELQRATRNRVGPLWLARTVKPILDLASSSGISSMFNAER
jgi:O-antigen/teichoic acid export membrane protein/aminoglycoside phosphotransferase